MNLTKNQIYIISAVVIAVIVWFVFFRKKTAKIAMAPAPAPAPAESNWNGAWAYTPEAAMRQATGSVGNSQAANISNYDGLPAFKAAPAPANFLGY